MNPIVAGILFSIMKRIAGSDLMRQILDLVELYGSKSGMSGEEKRKAVSDSIMAIKDDLAHKNLIKSVLNLAIEIAVNYSRSKG